MQYAVIIADFYGIAREFIAPCLLKHRGECATMPYSIWKRMTSMDNLNQSLVLGIFGLLGVIPCVGWVWAVFVAVWWCMGLTGAIRGVERPVPVLGGIRILL